jgi:hypothetical protein
MVLCRRAGVDLVASASRRRFCVVMAQLVALDGNAAGGTPALLSWLRQLLFVLTESSEFYAQR